MVGYVLLSLIDTPSVATAVLTCYLQWITCRAFYFGFQRNGVPFSALWLKYGNYDVDPDLFSAALVQAQSIYFFNLILIQWFCLMSTRTRKLSVFQQLPLGAKTSNFRLFPAMAISLTLAMYVHPASDQSSNAIGNTDVRCFAE